MTRTCIANQPVAQFMASNLKGILSLATPFDIAYGRAWYPEALNYAKHIALDSGLSVPQCAGLVAVASQQTEWWLNLRQATSAAIDGKCTHMLPKVNAKMRRILAGEDPASVVSGSKVESFYKNILDISSDHVVTIDRHAAAILHNSPDTCPINSSWYEYYANIYREVAAEKNMEPRILQAITWLAWRRLKAQKQVPVII